jgi:large subunit ribosomal protein L24
MKIKKGDKVVVISGKDKGKRGAVLRAFPQKMMVVVDKVNIKKRHIKPRKRGAKGDIVEFPAPFPVSKAMLICPKCEQPTRINYKIIKEDKYRICKKCQNEF